MEEPNEDPAPVKVKSEPKMKKRHKKKAIPIPCRMPSIVIPEKEKIFITADKTTCLKCECFPKEDPWLRNKKLLVCQKTPLFLYEYAAAVVDQLKFPEAFGWSMYSVAAWIGLDLHLLEYERCILVNKINGLRLLMLEDPSHLPRIGVRDIQHIKIITRGVRKLFGVEFVRFARSIGLPPRKPLTHCTWFKSRTGPTWGIRTNWTRCDLLRWMKIIMPEPVYLDHWDSVWYHKPDFPAVKFARVPGVIYRSSMPKAFPPPQPPPPPPPAELETFQEDGIEITVPRKFRLKPELTEDKQQIWIEVPRPEKKKKAVRPKVYPRETQLFPKPVSCEGLRGDKLLLARRKKDKAKFFPGHSTVKT